MRLHCMERKSWHSWAHTAQHLEDNGNSCIYALLGSFGAKITMKFIIYVHCVRVNGLNFVCKLNSLIIINDQLFSARFYEKKFDKCAHQDDHFLFKHHASLCGASTFQSNNRSCCACLIHRKSHPSHIVHMSPYKWNFYSHPSATKSLWNYHLVCEQQ